MAFIAKPYNIELLFGFVVVRSTNLVLFTAHLFTYLNRIKNKTKIKTNNYNNRDNLILHNHNRS